jgi:hypothetical protein
MVPLKQAEGGLLSLAAAAVAASTGLAKNGLTIAVILKPGNERLKDACVVGDTGRASTTIIAIQILVHYQWSKQHFPDENVALLTVKDQFAGATERISDIEKVRSGLSWEFCGAGPGGTRQQEVVDRASFTNSVDNILKTVRPVRNGVEIMGLVH